MELVAIPLDRVVKILYKYGYKKRPAPENGDIADLVLNEGSFALWDIGWSYFMAPDFEAIIASDEYSVMLCRQEEIRRAGGNASVIYVDPVNDQFLIRYRLKQGILKGFLAIDVQFKTVGYTPDEFIKLLFGTDDIKPPPNDPRSRRPAKTPRDWAKSWAQPGPVPA